MSGEKYLHGKIGWRKTTFFLTLMLMSIIFLLINAGFTDADENEAIIIRADHDALVCEYYPDTNFGSREFIGVGNFCGGEDVSFIKFSLSDIPSGSIITSAELKLYAYLISGDPQNVNVYELASSWNENTVTWNNRPTSYYTNPVSTQYIDDEDDYYVWDVTQHVDDWFSGDRTNYGFYLKGTSTVYNNYIYFNSDESSYYKPYLVVYYIPPPDPEVFSISCPNSICLGDTATIKIWGRNNGGEAEIGELQMSFPDLPDAYADSSHLWHDPYLDGYDTDYCNIYWPGDTIWTNYGSGITMEADYPLVSAKNTPWGQAQGDEFLEVHVIPPQPGNFRVFIKMTAGFPGGDWYGDPKEDGSESSQQDQQSEYVWVFTIDVKAPNLAYAPTSHDFGRLPKNVIRSTTFEIWNSGGGTLTWSLSGNKDWLSYYPSSGSSTGEHDTVTVYVDTTGLSEGDYSGAITISSNDGSGTFTVSFNMGPILSLSPSYHDFGDLYWKDVYQTTFEIWNSGAGTLTWNIIENEDWLTCYPTEGESTGERETIIVQVDTRYLPEYEYHYSGIIWINSNGGVKSFIVEFTWNSVIENLYSYYENFFLCGDPRVELSNHYIVETDPSVTVDHIRFLMDYTDEYNDYDPSDGWVSKNYNMDHDMRLLVNAFDSEGRMSMYVQHDPIIININQPPPHNSFYEMVQISSVNMEKITNDDYNNIWKLTLTHHIPNPPMDMHAKLWPDEVPWLGGMWGWDPEWTETWIIYSDRSYNCKNLEELDFALGPWGYADVNTVEDTQLHFDLDNNKIEIDKIIFKIDWDLGIAIPSKKIPPPIGFAWPIEVEFGEAGELPFMMILAVSLNIVPGGQLEIVMTPTGSSGVRIHPDVPIYFDEIIGGLRFGVEGGGKLYSLLGGGSVFFGGNTGPVFRFPTNDNPKWVKGWRVKIWIRGTINENGGLYSIPFYIPIIDETISPSSTKTLSTINSEFYNISLGNWTLFPRYYSPENHSVYSWIPGNKSGKLLTNVFHSPAPSILVNPDQSKILVWTDDNISKPREKSLEIYYSLFDPITKTWSVPKLITNNNLIDYCPTIIRDSSGHIVCFWHKITQEIEENITSPINYSKYTEIMYSIYNSTTDTWSNSTQITNNSVLDVISAVMAESDKLCLLFVEDNDSITYTLNDQVLFITYFENGTWTQPEMVINDIGTVTPPQMACFNNSTAIAWVRDEDRNITTINDREIYCIYSTNGIWSTPIKLTNNNKMDLHPSILFDSENEILVSWITSNYSMYENASLDKITMLKLPISSRANNALNISYNVTIDSAISNQIITRWQQTPTIIFQKGINNTIYVALFNSNTNNFQIDILNNQPHIYKDQLSLGKYEDFITLAYQGSQFSAENETFIVKSCNLYLTNLNIPPIADAGPDQAFEPGEIVYFDGSGSYDKDGWITNYTWDFGDGKYGYGETTSHVYSSPGVYYVTLTVRDDDGATGNDTCVIGDNTPPITNKTVGNPKYGENATWVTSNTPFNLTATDDLSGVNYTHYEIWWDSDNDGIIDTQVANATVSDNDANDLNPTIGNISVEFNFTEQCLHELKWHSVDNAGNVENSTTQIHYVDNTPPETTLSYGTPYYSNGIEEWITTSTPIYLNSTDYPECACGVEAIYYRINYGPWIEYTGPFTIDEECKHTIQWYSIDYLGNAEQIHSTVVNVDSSPPVTSLSYGTPYYTNGIEEWITTSTPITLNAIDEPSCAVGVMATYYRINGGNWSLYTQPFYINEECSHAIEYYSIDYLGNVESVKSVIVNVDSSPPETTISFGMPYYYDGNNWITTSTPIYLNATDYPDCACGVEAIYYRINAGEWMQYTGAFYMKEECSHIIYYYSVDYLGNAEEVKSIIVYVDETPPNISIAVGEPKKEVDGKWYVTSHTYIGISAMDEGCNGGAGVDTIYYRIWYNGSWSNWMEYSRGITLQGECTHYLEVNATDYLGNSYIENYTFYVDDTPPISYIEVEIESLKNYVTPLSEFTIFVDDQGLCEVGDYIIYFAVIGPENSKFYWNSNYYYYECNGEWHIATINQPVAFQIRDENGHAPYGVYTVKFYAEDILGNVEEKHKETFKIDLDPPETTISFDGPTYEQWISPITKIKLNANDDGSGIKFIKYKIDEKGWKSYTEPFTLLGGQHTIYYYSIDNIGNKESEHITTLYVDANPPYSYISFNGKYVNGETTCITKDTSIILQANDVGCGLKTIYYCIDGKDWNKYSEPIILNNGLHKIEYYGVDNVENKENIKTINVGIDASPPQITIDTPKPSYIYILGREILPLPGFIHADAIIIGSVKIKASASDECGISDMKLYIDNKLVNEGSSIEYNWNGFSFKRHVIKVEARDKLGNEISKEINVLLINFGTC